MSSLTILFAVVPTSLGCVGQEHVLLAQAAVLCKLVKIGAHLQLGTHAVGIMIRTRRGLALSAIFRLSVKFGVEFVGISRMALCDFVVLG